MLQYTMPLLQRWPCFYIFGMCLLATAYKSSYFHSRFLSHNALTLMNQTDLPSSLLPTPCCSTSTNSPGAAMEDPMETELPTWKRTNSHSFPFTTLSVALQVKVLGWSSIHETCLIDWVCHISRLVSLHVICDWLECRADVNGILSLSLVTVAYQNPAMYSANIW